MAITYLSTSVGNYIVLGLASDTKPAAVSGAIFLETDTGFIYKNIATVWTLVPFGGATTWGSITGTLSSQADLQTALDNKLDDTQFSGVAKISVGTTTPVGPSVGDLWVDTN